MGQDRHIAGGHEVEEKLLDVGGRRMVGRLDQHVAGIGDRKQLAGAKPGNEIGGHMHVRAGGQPQRDAVFVKRVLKLFYGLPNRRTGIVIQARQDMRRAGDHRYALLNRCPRHLQRDG